MDGKRQQSPKSRWDWLPAQMPGIAKLMADKRRELGDAWVDECWRKGVLERRPGWFFASEGALHVGTLADDPAFIRCLCAPLTETQAFLMLADRSKRDGT